MQQFSFRFLAVAIGILLAALPAQAQNTDAEPSLIKAPSNPERTWTQAETGKTLLGSLAGLQSGGVAILIIQKRKIRVPLKLLTKDDLKAIFRILASGPITSQQLVEMTMGPLGDPEISQGR